MKTQPYTYTIIIYPADPDETGYWVEVPALPGCFTQGETTNDCLIHAEEAIRCYVEGLIEDGEDVPEEPRGEYGRVCRVTTNLSLPV